MKKIVIMLVSVVFLAFMFVVSNAAQSDPDVEAGAKIFSGKCKVCHGAEGKGDGPAGKAMKPPPRDLTDKEYMKTKKDEELIATIKDGKGKMPSWKKVLSDDDINKVVKFIRSLAK